MLTTFLFAASLSLAAPQGDPKPQSPADVYVEHIFGKAGEAGSFRARFDRRGAGLERLQLLDHYPSPAAARKAQKEPGDYRLYQLLVYGAEQMGYRLEEQPAAGTAALLPMALDGVFDGVGDPSKVTWTATDVDGGVRLAIGGNGYTVTKTFTLRPGFRGLQLQIELKNDSVDTPPATASFLLHGPVVINPAEASLFGNPAVAIGIAADGSKTVVKPKAGPLQPLLTASGNPLLAAGTSNRYFASFLTPLDDGSRDAVLRADVESLPLAIDTNIGNVGSVPRIVYALRLPVPKRGASTTLNYGLYFGPKSFHTFAEQPEHERYLPILDVDLEPPCCISVPGGLLMAKTLVRVLGFFHGIIGNWGVAIMMLTVLVRMLLAPVNFRMQKSMRAYGARMAKVQPLLAKLKEKYADDPKEYQAKMVAFQREHKLMPPIGGCLPIFLTMPIYLGLFSSLRTAYDLRQQPFLWITDLSQPDALFHLGLTSWLPSFNLLPLCWLGLFLFMQLRMPLPTDPQQRQVQMMMRFMPMLFGVMLYNYASGLMVYMVTSMLWSLVESSITKRILGPLDPNVQAMAPTPTF
jgi:YidC/Oxa1 family membrane protein insertase